MEKTGQSTLAAASEKPGRRARRDRSAGKARKQPAGTSLDACRCQYCRRKNRYALDLDDMKFD